MKPLFSPAFAVLSIFCGLALLDSAINEKVKETPSPAPGIECSANPKIQAAILLDVSGSMDGLIEQAKAQLWNMVSVMGRVKCGQSAPQIEIALYEYGRTTNSEKEGYIKQISAFSTDLDQLSQELFKLTTNGGDEYCGHVILTSLGELRWDTASTNYKVIFIAGNEDFLQGSVAWTAACREAKRKGVIVNTIYCGNKEQGIREHWNLAGECGNGSYTNIDQNAEEQNIPTPYDSLLFLYNDNLNSTYLAYGTMGTANYAKQGNVDKLNRSMRTPEAMVKRVEVKSNRKVYGNESWDLVDAVAKDSLALAKIDSKTLPDSLKNKSRAELEQIVNAKAAERNNIQKGIIELVEKRNAYIAAEKAKIAVNNASTLETEVERMIREQVKRFNMQVQ